MTGIGPGQDAPGEVHGANALLDLELAGHREFLIEQPDLGPKQWPTFVRIAAELPRTESFKVIKRQLAAQGTTCEDAVWPIRR